MSETYLLILPKGYCRADDKTIDLLFDSFLTHGFDVLGAMPAQRAVQEYTYGRTSTGIVPDLRRFDTAILVSYHRRNRAMKYFVPPETLILRAEKNLERLVQKG